MPAYEFSCPTHGAVTLYNIAVADRTQPQVCEVCAAEMMRVEISTTQRGRMNTRRRSGLVTNTGQLIEGNFEGGRSINKGTCF